MPELSAPLRVTWDLPAEPNTATTHWKSLVRARVLYVELRLTLENLGGLTALGDGLCVPGTPQVTLSASVEAAAAGLSLLPAACLPRVDLLVLPPHRNGLPSSVTGAWRSLTLAVWSTAEGLQEFSSALRAASARGGGTVAVLNPPAPAMPLTSEQRHAAAATWAQQQPGAVNLRVHDLFLAHELGLEPFREYAGCQAGGGLAHLDAAGVVTACRTLPVVLGDLGEQDLPEIWCGRPRRVLRARLREVPTGCADCEVAGRCQGGCRGLLAPGAVAVDLETRDPSCPGPWRSATRECSAP